MINATLEIPYNLKEKQTNRITLLRRRFSGCQLEVSREENGHLRGWATAGETREVKLKGLPAYLDFKRVIQLLNQSYLKLQKETIEVLPKGLGGEPKHSRPFSALGSNKAKTCKKKALQLVEAMFDDEERRIVREAVEGVLKNDSKEKDLNLSENRISYQGAQALGTALQVNQTLQALNLERNEIGAAGAQILGAARQVNQSLQVLNLGYNRIGAVGAEALGAALQVNQSFQSLMLFSTQIGDVGTQALATTLQVNQTIQSLNFRNNAIDAEGIITNTKISTFFQQQITQVKNFLQSHENDEGIILQNLPQLKELLQKWHINSNNLIPSLETILRQSERTNLNDRYREKLEGIIMNLTNRLHDLWFESFEEKVVTLSNEYVMGKEPSEKRNVDLGYALYGTWLTFLGANCPDWVENHIQSFIPFGVLLDIAEDEGKKNVTELKNPHLLFKRVLSLRNESKDLLFSLTNQSQKS